MENKMEKIKKIAVKVLVVAILLALIGTVLMFLTNEEKTHYTPSYTYHGVRFPGYSSTWTVYYPEAGAMPLVGTLLLICSFVCLHLAAKKEKEKLVLVSGIVGVVGSVLLLASYGVVADFYWNINELGEAGYALSSTAGSLAFVISVFTLTLYFKANKSAQNGRETSGASSYHDYAAELTEAKSLFDSGIFSQEEYEREKARINAKYGRV